MSPIFAGMDSVVVGVFVRYILRLRGAHAALWRAHYLPQVMLASRSIGVEVRQALARDLIYKYICVAMKDSRNVSWLSRRLDWNLPPEDVHLVDVFRRIVIKWKRRNLRISRTASFLEDGVNHTNPMYDMYDMATVAYRRDGQVLYVTDRFSSLVYSCTMGLRNAIRETPSYNSNTFRECRQQVARLWIQTGHHNVRVISPTRHSSDCSLLVKLARR